MRVPPGDDAAVLLDGTAITADTLVESVHFDERLSPADVGWKALAVSVSDLAAMGARPAWAVLSLSLPQVSDAWIEDFASGLASACATWSVRVVGGDTTGSPGPRVVALTLGGPCVAEPLTRAGARPGHTLWLTGTPGLAGAGWSTDDPGTAALQALRRPRPPLDFALAVAQAGLASAAMDLSDGLASDLPRLAAASGCRVELDESSLPSHPELDALPTDRARFCRLAGGEDYALLFTAPPAHAPRLRALAAEHDVALHAIGQLTAGTGAVTSGGPWPDGSFTHFAEAS